MFYTRFSGPPDYLWTVGFDHPRLGWQPESDHGGESAADARVEELNRTEERYVYTSFEPGLWTVGDSWPAGDVSARGFDPVSDHGSAAEAAEETIRLNA